MYGLDAALDDSMIITNPFEVLAVWFSDENLLIGTILIALIIFGLAFPSIKALRGGWRSWVAAPGVIAVQITMFQARHRWPYMLLSAAIAIFLATPSIYFEAAGDEAMRQLWWKLPFFWIPWGFCALAIFWWPRWATPLWNRDWEVRHESDKRANPFTDQEIDAINAMSPGRKRRRLQRNINACALYLAGKQNAFVPWWDDPTKKANTPDAAA